MLKITILACAIISMPPVLEATLAGDRVAPASDMAAWPASTGFVDIARAPTDRQETRPASATNASGDPDVVGSIPPAPIRDPYLERMLGYGTTDVRSCARPSISADEPAGQDLACGGAGNNRWSARVEHFNYDLSAADMSWVDPLLRYPGSSVAP